MKSIVSKYVMCLFVMVVLSNRIYGATRYWDNGGTDNNWSNPTNWTSDTPPVTGDTVKLENSAPNEAQIINLDTSVSLSAIQCSATGDRSYTIETSNDSTLTLTGSYDVDGSTMTVDLTFDVDILVSGSEIRFYRSVNGTIIVNGEIDNVGGTHTIFGNYSGFLTLAGSNTASTVQNNDDGEILAKHFHALGDGTYRNGGAGATLALATNVTIYNYLQVNSPMNLRIKDAGASDVTLTVKGACIEGLVTVLPNTGGSTGNLIIEAQNNQQSEWILTTNSTLVFARESGTALWGHADPGYYGWVSGGGSVLIDCPDGVSCYITNDFSGGIIITNGSLNIQGNDYLPTNGAVTVLSGTTLRLVGSATQTVGAIKGNGTVDLDNSVLTVKTALEPGASDAGTLAVINNGTFILKSGCTSVFELDAIAGTSDQVTFNSSGGDLTLAGELNVENLGGLEAGDYKLFDLSGGTVSGNFSSINMPRSFLGEVSVSGGDVILTVTLAPQGTVIMIN